jgi:hypothetical protein
MLRFQRIPQYIYERYVSWKSGTGDWNRQDWINRAAAAEEYYYNDVDKTGTTFTSAQARRIAETTNIPVSINFLHPICNQKLALLAQTKPSIKTMSSDGRAKEEAWVLDKMRHGIFYTSDATQQIESMIKDMLISGIGHIMVNPSNYYNDGMYGLTIDHVAYDEVILDRNSRKKNNGDMEGFFIEKEFTIAKSLQLYGDILMNLRHEDGRPVDMASLTGETWVEDTMTDKAKVTTTQYNNDDRIRVREFYEKVFTTMYGVRNSNTGLIEYKFKENMTAEEQSLLATAEFQQQGIYVQKTIIMGDFAVWTEILPISEYPISTVYFEWGGKPYRSYGMIHFTKDMQDAYDKIMQTMILNGILSNNAGWTSPKGAIPEQDMRKWENYANDPRVIKEYVPVVKEGQVLVPEKEKVNQLSNFYPMVLDMLKSGIEYSTGISAILQGNAKEAGVEVFSSLQQYQNAAMMRVVLSTAHVNEALKNLGMVLTQYMVSQIEPKDYQFFDEKGNLNEIQIAQELANNIRMNKFSVVSIPTPAMPTQRLSMATELAKIAQSSPDANERSILTQKAMELSDIREYEDVREKLDVVRNTQAQLEQLQAAYDRLTETSKQMENKVINTQIENRILQKLAAGQSQIAAAVASAQTEVKNAEQLEKEKAKNAAKTSV